MFCKGCLLRREVCTCGVLWDRLTEQAAEFESNPLTQACGALETPGKGEAWTSVIFNTLSFCPPSTGCILGVGLVLSLMSHSSQAESRVHVAASLRKLSAYLDDSGSQSRTFQEVGGEVPVSFPSPVFASWCCLFSASHILVTLELNSFSPSSGIRRKIRVASHL